MATIVNMPRINLNEDESMIGEMTVSEGDRVAEGDSLFTVETDKTSLVVYAETDGVVLKCLHQEFDTVPVLAPVCIVGDPDEDISGILADLETNQEKPSETKAGQTKTETKPETGAVQAPRQMQSPDTLRISPRAKRLAEMNGVDYTTVSPSGAEGRIVETDIIEAMNRVGDVQEATEVNTVKLTKIRRVIAKNMLGSLQGMAQLTHTSIFDATQLLDLREKFKAQGKAVTIGDIILFGTVKTLEQFGEMNAHMPNDEEIILYKDVNLGLAVDTERGLMVPTIMRANHMTVEEISSRVRTLAEACRENRIVPEELQNATFTVSNLGNLGVRFFTPIINPPQVGILGVGCIDYMAKKEGRGFTFYPACYLSLTYDHRAIDGAPSQRFFKQLCENMENIQELIK